MQLGNYAEGKYLSVLATLTSRICLGIFSMIPPTGGRESDNSHRRIPQNQESDHRKPTAGGRKIAKSSATEQFSG